ncbi:MAG: response regulator, partial [Syntrophales bacterium LBB04]|nr:response regulator [Syntrophales bacterium LBB04]
STKQRGDRKGMGLGLTICHSVIQKHGGAITVASKEGVGTTFDIYLPISGKELQEEKAPGVGEVLPGKGRILVMDDEEMVRDVVGEMLQLLGYEVAFAGDGQGAVELYRRAREHGEPFDIVILDLTVRGGMGGNEAIKRLLEIDPNVKTIVSSGFSNNPILLEFEQYGFKGALTKPYRIGELSKTLSKIIGRVP